jgi:hypothetical protein
MKKIYLLALGLVALSFQSCEDAFTQVIEIKQDPIQESLVPNAYLNNIFADIITVNKTKPVTDPSLIQQVNNAVITIFENDVQKDIYQVDSTFNGFNFTPYYKTSLLPKPGNRYRLEVKAAGFPDAQATDTMPQITQIKAVKTGKVVFKKINLEFGGGGASIEDSFVEVKLTIPDVLGKDYYRILIDSKVNAFGGQIFDRQILTNDILFQDIQNIGIIAQGSDRLINCGAKYFNDALFDGQSRDVYIYLPQGGQNSPFFEKLEGRIYFTLQHHSRSSYLHNTSLANYEQINGNPFAQPVLIHSNFTGGFGILGCNTVAVDSLDF